jgi:hypothetical protein
MDVGMERLDGQIKTKLGTNGLENVARRVGVLALLTWITPIPAIAELMEADMEVMVRKTGTDVRKKLFGR